jgi:hypothetical protein
MRPDVVVLGSSRVVYGVDSEAVDAVFDGRVVRPITSCNVAIVGSTFAQDYYTLMRVVEVGVTPKVVEDPRKYNFTRWAEAPADTSKHTPA